MKSRVLAAIALVVSSWSHDGTRAYAQAAPAPGVQAAGQDDAVSARDLLQRLEQVVRSGDPAMYLALLDPTADHTRAAAFAEDAFERGATRVVIQERERVRLTRTDQSVVYRLVVDAFTEFGDRAIVSTWQIEAEPAAQRGWLIADQRLLSSVQNLFRLSVTSARQFAAKNLQIRAEDLELTMVEGAVFTVDAGDTTTGLVLLGRGEMRFEPTPETEKGQVRIFAGDTAVATRFDAAFVRLGSLDGHVDLSQLDPRPVDARELRRAEQVFRDESPKSFVLDLGDLSRDAWSLLPSADDFLAEIRTRRYGTLTYAKSDTEAENISFFERRRQRNIAVYASAARLASRGRFYDEDALAAYDVLHYDIDLAFQPDRLWLDGATTMRLRIKTTVANQLTLRLADSLIVRSIVSDRFGRLFSLRAKGQNAVLVNLPYSVLPETELSLTIEYAGRLEPQPADRETVAPQQESPSQTNPDLPQPTLSRGEPNFLYSNRSYWYPQAPVTDFATAVMHITVPNPYGCVASGMLQRTPLFVTAVGSQPGRLFMFRADRPLRYLSFVVSRFERYDGQPLTFAPRVLPAPTITRALPSGAVMLRPLPQTDDPPELPELPPVFTSLALQVEANPRQTSRAREYLTRASDVARFYDSIVGDVPYESFTMALTEHTTPGGHSPGYFAILSQPLPNSGLVWRNDPSSFDGYPEFFLAHELAHQWWGQAVGWRNYHEQWLSEGFAQYFAALYAERARGPEAFASILRQMRKWAMDASDQGPVYLGYRLGHIRSDGRVYRALVYNKGATVLHMLRRLVGDQAFFSGLRRYYADQRYRKAGTEDLRIAMEAESGQSLSRFFEQWIYGAALPSLKFGSRVENGPAGPQLVVHIEQQGELFDVPLALTIDYADRPSTHIVVPVTDRVVDARFPLAGTFRSVDVNKGDGVLAEPARLP
jgi:hypothetical protein